MDCIVAYITSILLKAIYHNTTCCATIIRHNYYVNEY